MSTGESPPSSSEKRLIEVAAAAIMRLPITVEPMVVSSLGMVEPHSGPSSAIPVPLTTLITPGGMPVPSANEATSVVASGVTSDGLMTHVHPDARMGPSL